MSRFLSSSTIVKGYYQEAIVQKAAKMLRLELGQNPTFAVVFATPHYMDHFEDFIEVIRVHGHVSILIGCSGSGILGRSMEIEGEPGFSISFYSIPGAVCYPFSIQAEDFSDNLKPEDWVRWSGISRDQVKLWMTFLDPFQFPVEDWLQDWNRAYPGVPVFGGLASAMPQQQKTWVFWNDRLIQGAIVMGLSGDFEVECVVSQGCRPIGDPLTVTKVNENVLYSLGSQPALEVLNHVYESLPEAEKKIAQGHIFAGLAMSEYQEDFKSGDFLIRNIFGADPMSGAVAIGGFPRVGQTLQYQIRDSQIASDEFIETLKLAHEKRVDQQPFGALICTCVGRGERFFKTKDHDVLAIHQFFPGVSLSGLFANGEIGPVGGMSFAHAYTASVVLFYEKKSEKPA